MKPTEFKTFITIKSYDENTAENYQNCYVAEKINSFQTIEYIVPKF